jgi:multidrug efflux pump subunit AcrB
MLFILMLQLHSTQKLLLAMLTAPLAIIGVTLAADYEFIRSCLFNKRS